MAPRSKSSSSARDSSANLGFEAKLWLAADKLRNNMDAAEYKHIVLGLIFLKYISDTFEEHRAKLVAAKGDYAGANPEDQDEDTFVWAGGDGWLLSGELSIQNSPDAGACNQLEAEGPA